MKNIFKLPLFKSLSTYTIANILNSAIPFLLLPFLTNHLTPYDYGILSIFMVFVQFTTPLAGLNFNTAVNRQYFDLDTPRFKNYVGNSLVILVSSSIFLITLLLIFRTPLSNFTSMPSNWLWVVGAYCFAQNLALTLLTIWQVKVKPKKYGIFRISRTSLDVGLSILFILVFEMAWQGRILGMFIAMILFATIASIVLAKNNYLNFKFSKTDIIDNLKYSTPLIPHTLGSVLIIFTDRIIISKILGIEEAGLYDVGYQIGMIVYLVQNSFNQAWTPWFFNALKKNNDKLKKKIVNFTYIYFLGMIIIVCFVSFLSPWFFDTFLNKNFSQAINYVFWIALGFGFNGMYKMVVNYIFYIKKTYLISIVTISIAILNIILNIIFVKKYGAIGAAQVSALCFFIQFLIVWIISSKHYKMPWLNKLK